MQQPTRTITVKEFRGKYSPDPILTNAQNGRDRLGARIHKDSLKQQIRKDQLKNAGMRCHESHKISKSPCGHPTDHIHVRRRPLTALSCNKKLTLPKLHLATSVGLNAFIHPIVMSGGDM